MIFYYKFNPSIYSDEQVTISCYENIYKDIKKNSNENKHDINENKQNSNEDKQNSNENKQNSNENKQNSNENKQNSNEDKYDINDVLLLLKNKGKNEKAISKEYTVSEKEIMTYLVSSLRFLRFYTYKTEIKFISTNTFISQIFNYMENKNNEETKNMNSSEKFRYYALDFKDKQITDDLKTKFEEFINSKKSNEEKYFTMLILYYNYNFLYCREYLEKNYNDINITIMEDHEDTNNELLKRIKTSYPDYKENYEILKTLHILYHKIYSGDYDYSIYKNEEFLEILKILCFKFKDKKYIEELTEYCDVKYDQDVFELYYENVYDHSSILKDIPEIRCSVSKIQALCLLRHIEELETQIKYTPGNSGYEECQNNFNDVSNNKNEI
jgi:hypothetical protein